VNIPITKRFRAVLAAAAAVAGLTGCASTANNPKDPFEGFNRAMFSVNEGLDAVAKPIAEGYDAALPQPVKTGIGNFFGNIADPWIAINNLLQGKFTDGVSDFARVFVNTTAGIVGLIDVASYLGLEKHAEDFGQTLGRWGLDTGPYLYWPIIGPRNVRDTFGFAADAWADPLMRAHDVRARNTLTAVRFIDVRASLLPADKVVEAAAFDKYSYIRNAYLQMRRNAVYDGHPPPLEEEDDEEDDEKGEEGGQ
jgi:phospholipid-binding lipoprotein MlaA